MLRKCLKERIDPSSQFNEEGMKNAVKAVLNDKKSTRKAAEEFGVNRSTLVSRLKKVKAKIAAEKEKSGPPNETTTDDDSGNEDERVDEIIDAPLTYGSKFAAVQVFTVLEEEKFAEYLEERGGSNDGMTRLQMRKLAAEYAVRLGCKNTPSSWKENMVAGKHWFTGFMKRHPNLKPKKPERTRSARSVASDRKNDGAFFEMLKTALERHEDKPQRISNLDEAGISTVATPPKVTRVCAVLGCPNGHRRNREPSPSKRVSLHSFPSEEPFRSAWIAFCGRKNTFDVQHASICSIHFCPNDGADKLRHLLMGYWPIHQKQLKHDAVPTLHGPKMENICSGNMAYAEWPERVEVKTESPLVEGEPSSTDPLVDSPVDSEPTVRVKEEFIEDKTTLDQNFSIDADGCLTAGYLLSGAESASVVTSSPVNIKEETICDEELREDETMADESSETPSLSDDSCSGAAAVQNPKEEPGGKRLKRFACDECDYKASWAHNLKQHKLIHTDEKPFSCGMCDFKCRNADYLKTHLMIHTGEKPFSCSMCGYSSCHRSRYESHVKIHADEKPYQCSLCDYKSRERGNMKRHMRTHTGEKLYSCSLCDRKFTQSHHLKDHVRIHGGGKPRVREKQYQCSFCDYTTTRSSHLKSHVMIHTGERPHVCEVCDYKCRAARDLKVHMMIHSGEKPYSCEQCGYKCRGLSDLKRHARIHTGEKPHSCMICEYRTRLAGDLKRHMKRHAGDEGPY